MLRLRLLPYLLLAQLLFLVQGSAIEERQDAQNENNKAQSPLANDALQEIIARASPIFGFDEGCKKSDKTCDWMANVPDKTPVVHLNIPGTHDTATWNYSQATQDSLLRYTGPMFPADVFRCQERSIAQSLNGGIRAFDFRYSYNPGNDTIGFYHSDALLAPATTLDDVLYGIYNWLDSHRTEALFISLMYESGDGRVNDAGLEMKLYNTLFGGPGKRYWVQEFAKLGSLGEARGKITLLQRFTFDLLPKTPEFQDDIGIPLPPSLWTDNTATILIPYNANATPPSIAYIEDFYEPHTTNGTGPAVDAKFAAVQQHLLNATSATLHPDQLSITFTSAENDDDGVFPRFMALGNGTILGVNQRLLPFIKDLHAKAPGGKARLGIVLMDFWDAVDGLIEAVIGL